MEKIPNNGNAIESFKAKKLQKTYRFLKYIYDLERKSCKKSKY